MKYCTVCGLQNEADDRFCANCGATLQNATQPQNAARGVAEQSVAPGYPPQSQWGTPGYPPQPQWGTPGYAAPSTAYWPDVQDEATSGGRSFAVCFKKYCRFQGRATRGEFWSWMGLERLDQPVFLRVVRVV